MLFSSLLFLYLFLPFVLLGYILIQKHFRNSFLLIASLLFFAWGGVSYTLILIGSILLNFFGGILISNNDLHPKRKRSILIIVVVINLSILCIFKYTGFFLENLNLLFDKIGTAEINKPKILLPIGISFYTFHGLSYIIDVYRGTTKAQKKLVDLGLYIAFFPQLIAGPIVRYKDISEQLAERNFSYLSFNKGIYRFLLGLGKKVLIANTLATVADTVFKMNIHEIGTTLSWIGIIFYSFQLYFDFSGYSDMAIGLALMFGFHFNENFNYPFLSESVKDFWRRWHISLSTWFNDYLFVPIATAQRDWGKFAVVFALLITFLISGFWHGAGWTFIIFGLVHGAFIILEFLWLGKLLKKIWYPLRTTYTILVVMAAWVLFRSHDVPFVLGYYRSMMGFGNVNLSFMETLENYLNKEQLIALFIAATGAFGLLNYFEKGWFLLLNRYNNLVLHNTMEAAKLFLGLAVLFLCTVYLISNSYNPFIYFHF